MIDRQTSNTTYSSPIAHQHTALLTLPDRSMPPMEADTAYQGCLPVSYTVDHSLFGIQVHARLRTHGLRNLEIVHTSHNPEIACAISGFRECATQSRDCTNS